MHGGFASLVDARIATFGYLGDSLRQDLGEHCLWWCTGDIAYLAVGHEWKPAVTSDDVVHEVEGEERVFQVGGEIAIPFDGVEEILTSAYVYLSGLLADHSFFLFFCI